MISQAIFYLFSSILVISSVMVTFARNPVHSVLYLILAFFNAAGLFILLNAELLAMLLVIVYVGAVAVLFLFVVMMMNIVPTQRQTENFWSFAVANARMFLKFLAYGCAFLGTTALISTCVLPLVQQTLLALQQVPQSTHIYYGYEERFWISGIIGWILTWMVFRKKFQISMWNLGCNLIKSLPLGGILGAIVLAEVSYVLAHRRLLFLNTPPSTNWPVVDNTRAVGRILYTDYIFLFETAGMILLTAMIGAIILTHRKREGVRRQDVRAQMARRKEDTLTLHDLPIGKGLE